jgi:NADPH2:quinone reductase
MGFSERLPAVIGFDLFGTVVKTRQNLSSFPIRSHVFSQALFQYSHCGGLQEYTLVDPQYTAIVPPSISDLDAAVFPINAVSSALSLFSSSHGFSMPLPRTPESKSFDYKSQKVVIISGGTNTGKLAVELARIAGIGTIIAAASLS